MLFTKECDYAIRIMRALSSGELISVSRICEMEHLPSAMTYKITRKLEKSGFLKSCRGTNGGYALNLKLAEISLYDLCAAIDPDILLLECMKASRRLYPLASDGNFPSPRGRTEHKMWIWTAGSLLSSLLQRSLPHHSKCAERNLRCRCRYDRNPQFLKSSSFRKRMLYPYR